MKKRFYVSYIRWSTTRQGGVTKDSRGRQTKSTTQWAEKNGYTLLDHFIDEGKSGYKGKNLEHEKGKQAAGELARFFEQVTTGVIKPGTVLAVENADRFSRLPARTTMTLFLQLINAGIGVVFTGSTDQQIITADWLDKNPHYLGYVLGEMIRAHAESARKSDSVKSGLATLKAALLNGANRRSNAVPKYFVWVAGKYQHHPQHVPLIRELAADLINGKTLYSVAKDLNQRGIKTFRRGFQWSANTVRVILNNRVMLGEFMGREDYFPPILKPEQFDRLQVIFKSNPKYRGNGGETVNIFRSLCFCKHCKQAMTVLGQKLDPHSKKPHQDPWRYRYLRCPSHSSTKECPSTHSLKLQRMEVEFFGNFLLTDPKQYVTTQASEETKSLNKAIATTQTTIAKYTEQINKLVALSDTLDLAELKTKLAKLNKDRDTAKMELDSLNSQLNRTRLSPTDFDDIRGLFDATEKEMPLRHKDGKVIGDEYVFHLTPSESKLDDAYLRLQETLKQPTIRERIRVLLPSLIGRIDVDTETESWTVKNHAGNTLYESLTLTVD